MLQLQTNIILLLLAPFSADMISKCAVNGTQVEFHCPDAYWWVVGSGDYTDDTDVLTVDAIIDTDDNNYTTGGYQIVDISCYSDGYIDTSLIITGKLHMRQQTTMIIAYADENEPEVPLDVYISIMTKTSLLIDWDAPPVLGSDIEFEALLNGKELEVTGTSLLLDLEGQECQPFKVSISMPGNCEDFIVEGSLLRGEHIRYQTAWHACQYEILLFSRPTIPHG